MLQLASIQNQVVHINKLLLVVGVCTDFFSIAYYLKEIRETYVPKPIVQYIHIVKLKCLVRKSILLY